MLRMQRDAHQLQLRHLVEFLRVQLSHPPIFTPCLLTLLIAMESKASEQQQQATPEPPHPTRGCSHYKRGAVLLAPCCGKLYACRFCHDEVEDEAVLDPKKAHKMDRKAVLKAKCAACGSLQPMAQNCGACGVQWGAYYCDVCKLLDDDGAKKQIWHCSGCGICRVGGEANYFHWCG